MKRFPILILAIVTILTLAACIAAPAQADDGESAGASGFSYDLVTFLPLETWIITDNATGEQYLFIDNGNGGGLTLLEAGYE